MSIYDRNARTVSRISQGQAAQKAGKYTNISSGGSKASQRRKKLAKQKALADQKAAAVAKIQAAEKAAANKAAEVQRAAQAARMQAVNNPPSVSRTPPEMDPRVIAAQQAAARQAQMGSVKPKPRPSVTNDQGPLQKAYNDFLMDIGVRDKTQDYYDRLSDRTKDAKDRVKDATKITTDGPSTRLPPPITDVTGDPPPDIGDPFRPPVMPPQSPQYPGYGGGMMGGIGAFGYNPALMQFESQQGAGQVPYYMAAARNAQTPNMSPAFMHAARNYDILGGSQRTAPRPMEMMSAAERAQIAGMSNFNTPNYNSPYDQFNFFSNMVGGGGGKGMGRPAPQMAGGLAPFMSGMFG